MKITFQPLEAVKSNKMPKLIMNALPDLKNNQDPSYRMLK